MADAGSADRISLVPQMTPACPAARGPIFKHTSQVIAPIFSPILLDTSKIAETGISDATLYLPIEASPADAIQPHSVQTGSPPN